MTVEDRLRDVPAPGEREAASRAWATVRAAAPAAPPRRVTTGSGPFVVLAAAAALALALAAALTPAGASISRLVRHAVDPPPAHHRAPAHPRLPARGRVLVATPGAAWVVHRSGAAKRLADVRDPAWSPHGIYVAGARKDSLVVLTPAGALRWRLPGRDVRDPRWSADGLYVAYESAGALHRVWGNGAHDVEVTEGRGARAWAWRPGVATSPQTFAPELAYVTRGGELILRHMFTAKVLWRRPLGALRARSLAWSPDGRRLVVVGRRVVILRGRDGKALGTIPVPAGAAPRAAAVSPDGGTAALTSGGTLVAAPLRPAGAPVRTLLTRPARLGAPTFSPDGRWVLVTSGAKWLFVPVGGGPPRTVTPAGRAFGGAAPRVAGWTR
jgi:hypothetical protein